MPKISVIVPVYNVEPYIHRCIDSILNQTFTDFELILIDDGSPDNCGKICDEYAEKDNRIHVIHQENGGLSAARNAGIDWAMNNSDSEWITFIDSDDWIHFQMFSSLINTAICSQQNLVVCDFDCVDNYIPDAEYNEDNYQIVSQEDAYCNHYRVCITATLKLYKKHLFNNIRFPLKKLCEDAFTTYKILFSEESIAIINYPFYHIFQNPNSITRSKWSTRRLDEVDAHEEILYFLKQSPFKKAYNYEIYRYMRVLMFQYWHINDSYENSNKNLYLKHITKKLRKAIYIYKKNNNFKIKTNIQFYKCAYPLVVKLYSILYKLRYKKNL